MFNANQYLPTTSVECNELKCDACIFWCYGDAENGCELHDSLHDAGVNEI